MHDNIKLLFRDDDIIRVSFDFFAPKLHYAKLRHFSGLHQACFNSAFFPLTSLWDLSPWNSRWHHSIEGLCICNILSWDFEEGSVMVNPRLPLKSERSSLTHRHKQERVCGGNVWVRYCEANISVMSVSVWSSVNKAGTQKCTCIKTVKQTKERYSENIELVWQDPKLIWWLQIQLRGRVCKLVCVTETEIIVFFFFS